MKKAISPMIAVVLLIAFTIGVGGLVSIFATGLLTTSSGISSNQSESLSRCAAAYIHVFRVTNTTVSYQNPTSQTLTGLTILYNGDRISVTVADQSLTPGESNVTQITEGTGNAGGAPPINLTGLSSPAVTGNSSVIVRGLCQSLVTVEGKCTSAQECWDV